MGGSKPEKLTLGSEDDLLKLVIVALSLSHLEDLALDALPMFQRVERCVRMAGSTAPAVFDDLILHIAPDKFYLESLSSTQSVLVIDRISYEISLQVKIMIILSMVGESSLLGEFLAIAKHSTHI